MDSAYNQVMPIRNGSEVDQFINRAASFFGWGTLNDQIVMDIGCGVGNTSKFLLGKFPRVYRILGIDLINEYIDTARREQWHEKIEYQVADITNRKSAKRWNMLIHKAVSVFCFNYIRDVKTAYQNLFKMLAYEGEAAVYLNLHSGYYDFIIEMFTHPKWSQYTKEKKLLIPESHIMKLDASYHTELLKEIGFYPVHAASDTKVYKYPMEEEFKNLIVLSCPHAANIPPELQQEFRQCALETFLKYNLKDENGIPYVQHKVVSLFIKRPWKPLYDSPLKPDTPEKENYPSTGKVSNGQTSSAKAYNGQVTPGKLSDGNVSPAMYSNGNAAAAEACRRHLGWN